MRAVEVALLADQKRREAKEASDRRLATARTAEDQLTHDERVELLGEMIRKVEAVAPAEPEPVASKIRKRGQPRPVEAAGAQPNLKTSHGSYTEIVEAFLASRPDGATAAEVAAHTGQSADNAGGVLRHLRRTKRAVRQGKLWCPIAKKAGADEMTVRAAIRRALNGGSSLGMADLFKAVLKLRPGSKYGSVAAELPKMQSANLLVVAGKGPNGSLYGLTSEGSASATMN